MGKIWTAVKRAMQGFSEDGCMNSGAALAYYTIFSLPPLLVIVFLLAGYAGVPREDVEEVVRQQLGMPVQEAGLDIGSQMEQAKFSSGDSEQKAQSTSLLGGGLSLATKIFGICLLIFSATGVFAQLQYALNRAFGVEPDPEQGGMINFVMKRLVSLGMVVVIAFLLLVSLVLTTLTDEFARFLASYMPETLLLVVGNVLNVVITLLLATLLFASMYKILPDAELCWRDTWVAAGTTAVLFVIGKTGIAFYLQNSQIGQGWESASASMVALLVWVYYSSLIVLLGAELGEAWAVHFGRGVQPEEGAVRKVVEKRHVRESAA